MTQSIKAIYDAILAAAKRDELIVVEPAADSFEAPTLCVVSTDTLEITPLAVIYGNAPKQSETSLVSADDDELLHSMGIKPFTPISEMDGVIFRD